MCCITMAGQTTLNKKQCYHELSMMSGTSKNRAASNDRCPDFYWTMCSSNPALYSFEHMVFFPECPVIFPFVMSIPASTNILRIYVSSLLTPMFCLVRTSVNIKRSFLSILYGHLSSRKLKGRLITFSPVSKQYHHRFLVPKIPFPGVSKGQKLKISQGLRP